MSDEPVETKLFAGFERRDDLLKVQQTLLNLDLYRDPEEEEEHRETGLLQQFYIIIDDYQEQPYLLDPYLEELLSPVVNTLKDHAKSYLADPSRTYSSRRIGRLSFLLYSYVKFRGYKAIIRYFPHEIADLSIVLGYALLPQGAVQDPFQWAIRYEILTWLSLISMIPFDLAQFDEAESVGKTADSLEEVGKRYLGQSGLDRQGAAILLSRLYMSGSALYRKDTAARFEKFLGWAIQQIETSLDVFMCMGILQTLCEVVKSGSVDQVAASTNTLFAIGSLLDSNEKLSFNTVIRKLRTKLVARIAIRSLPARIGINRRKGRTLSGVDTGLNPTVSDEDIDVPEIVETVLEQLFKDLQDKDTAVRWSAAKGIGRIADRLPSDFAAQVVETVLSLFSIHSVAGARLYDLPATAEGTWHGACLACAELARRSVLPSDKLPELIEWLSKALYFDLRKGAHSIGSNVRDAAAYVLWALARTFDHSGLRVHANDLARRLVTVALYDREIHIRRAASAAFQEHVGRTGFFPHGIDVLRKTDFYAVSIRKNSFLVAAPQIAEYLEYRSFLFDHLLDVTIRHWDGSMRQLGSQSLRFICQSDIGVLGPQAIARADKLLDSMDVTDTHGAILALTEIAIAYRSCEPAETVETHLRSVYGHLARIPQEVLFSPRNDIVTGAACRLLASTITLAEIELDQQSSFSDWKRLIDFGLKHRSVTAQDEAAYALGTIRSSFVQPALGKLLGAIDYAAHPECLEATLWTIRQSVGPSSKMKSNVEAKRNCYSAIAQIVENVAPSISTLIPLDMMTALYDALLLGLDDYTSDQRGDVGSWIRIASIQGLTRVSEMLLSRAGEIPNFESYLPPVKFHDAISGILKQGVERLDNVRQEAGNCILRLLKLPSATVNGPERWSLPGSEELNALYDHESGEVSWNDGRWLFPRAVRLLNVPHYRKAVLNGIVFSLGSKSESVQRPVAESLASYVQSIPISEPRGDGAPTVKDLVTELLTTANANASSNNVVIPILQALNVLLDTDALRELSESPGGTELLAEALSLSTRSMSRIKSVQRIRESMKVALALLALPAMFKPSAQKLPVFLAHQFPSVRSETAEHLYLTLQGTELENETDDVEGVLLETEWSSNNLEVSTHAARRVVQLLVDEE
ncbi:hypothetical protein AX16_003046 [Volvariella volvacea WC 439]|nr:hypothetical protein AX16_003046 [Volvariella volvacea WC 439]